MNLKRLKPTLIKLAMILFSTSLGVLCCDQIFRQFSNKNKITFIQDGHEINYHYFFNSRDSKTNLYIPNLKIIRKLVSSGTEVFQVIHNIDEFGRRIVPVTNKDRKNGLILFGDSFIYGYAVNDDQTIPYYLGKRLHTYMPYNYGISGGGMNTLYSTIKGIELPKQIPQKDSIAIYLYYNFHVNRIQNDFRNLANYYNSYELKGSDLKKLPLTLFSNILAITYDSVLFERLASSLLPAPPPNEKDYDLAVKLILESANEFKKQMPHGKFIVAIVGDDPKISNKLKANNIFFVNVPYIQKELTYFPFDNHYTAAGNAKMANFISDELIKNKLIKSF